MRKLWIFFLISIFFLSFVTAAFGYNNRDLVIVRTAQLSDLTDVNATSPLDSESLIFNGTSGYWEPHTIAGTGDITGVTAGLGLFGGGESGTVTLNVSAATCGAGNVSTYNGTGFECVTDQTGAGGSFVNTTGDLLYNNSAVTIFFNRTRAGIDLEVNASDWWDGYNSVNSTHFENTNGVLTIVYSWFSDFFDTLFSGKTTDDLTQGSSNLYDTFADNYSNFSLGWEYATNSTGADSFANNYSDYLNIKDYALNDSLWSLNYSTFLTHITWSNAVNGTLAELSTILGWDYYNSTDFDIDDYLLESNNTLIGNYSASVDFCIAGGTCLSSVNGGSNWNANYSNFTTGWLYATNSTGNITFELDPYWSSNLTAYNDSWLNTTNLTYHNYNSSGLIIDWNATGYIANWSEIIGTLSETLWNANYSTFLTHITWSNAVNGTLAEMSDVLGFGYYNITNAPIYENDTFAGNYSNFTTTHFYALNGTGITWAEATNGTLAELSTIIGFGYYNSTDFDIDDYLLESNNTLIGNYSASIDFCIAGGTCISGLSVGGETNWNANYSDYLNIKDYALNDSLWSLNYSNFSVGWHYATNSTGTAGIGECPTGQFVQNTTTGGVECTAPGGGGDITAVYPNDTYITINNSASGDVYIGYNTTLAGTNLSANSSDYWDNLDTFNTTHFSNEDGVLTLIISFLQGLFIDEADEGDLNVNQSDWWITYDSASDLNNLITIQEANITDLQDYLLESNNTLIGNYSASVDFCIAGSTCLSGVGAGAEPNWNANYSGYLITRDYALNDSLWSLNYSNFTTGWHYATNSTGNMTSELDPYWTSNLTAYNSSWLNTTNITYHNYNSSGLIRDWNATSLIANWSNVDYANSSGYWDSYDSTNSTHFENTGGVLTIVYSWFTDFFNTLFAGKTTDDLTQGSSNLYDTFADNYSNYSVGWEYSTNSTGDLDWATAMNNTLAQWSQVMNNTVTQWSQAYNGTLAKTDATNTFTGINTHSANISIGNNYIVNQTGSAAGFIHHNGTGWVIIG